jgi:plastocyanin
MSATETTRPQTREELPRWTRLAVLGFGMVSLAPLLMLLAGLIWGLDLGEAIGFLLPVLVLPAIAAFLVLRFGNWAKIVGIVIALAAIALMFWTAFGLAEPASFFDFVPGLLIVPGAIIAIVGCVAAIVAGRRGHRSPRAEGGERRTIRATAAIVGVLAAVSAVLTVTTRTTVGSGEGDATVALKDISFDAGSYDLAGGSSVVVRNEDPFLHTFTIDDLGIDVEVGPNSSKLVQIPSEAGTFVLYCRPHTSNPEAPSSDDMAASLTVG